MAEKTPEHRDETRRCVADGVRGLAILDRSAGRAGFRDAEEVGDALDRLGPESVGILFWTALCYGNSIRYSPLLKQPSGAKRFRRMVERSLALDERYFFAGPHRVLAGFFHEAPGIMGGDDDAARRHAEAAVRLFPQYAENPICRAENVWKPDGDDDRFRDDVRSALAVPEDACPDARPEQRAAQAYARRLGN